MFMISASILTDLGKGGGGRNPISPKLVASSFFSSYFTHFLHFEASPSGSLWYQVMEQERIEIRKFEEVVYEVYFILKTFSLMLHCMGTRFHGSSEIRMGNLVSYVKGVKSQIDVHLFRHIDRRLFSCSFY